MDCRINGAPRPLLVHALPSDGKTRDDTIALLQFEKWGVPFRSLAIFEDQDGGRASACYMLGLCFERRNCS